MAPPLVGFLAKHPAVDAILPLPHLKELFSGAAPLGEELENEARARLGCHVRQVRVSGVGGEGGGPS